MNKPLLIVGAVSLVAITAIGLGLSDSGFSGRFMNIPSTPTLERQAVRKTDITPSKQENLAQVVNQMQFQLSQSPTVTLGDLSTEIMKRKLNITSGWGKTTKVYDMIPLNKGPQPLQDCANGLIDGKLELGEWQFCYLLAKEYAPYPTSKYTEINLKEKVTELYAAKFIAKSFQLEIPHSPDTAEAKLIKNITGIDDIVPNQYLTTEKATKWFNTLNKKLQGKALWNEWNFKGDF